MTTGGQKARLSGRGSYTTGAALARSGALMSMARTLTVTRAVTPLRGGRARTGVLVIPRNGWHTGRRRRGIKLERGLGYTAEQQETGLRISGGLGLKGWRGSQSSGGSSPLQTALVYG
ncbi:hypothetical protein R3P38DRAFT_2774546 [Favolaschia claudopus]|uniref:Ribosomal protein L2 n=1 Tax=Favolaschia claudopus TaxID=2862362 RepID=A0AAW0BUJ1_9AGAR